MIWIVDEVNGILAIFLTKIPYMIDIYKGTNGLFFALISTSLTYRKDQWPFHASISMATSWIQVELFFNDE